MSMAQKRQDLEIPCLAIRQAAFSSIFIVQPIGDEAPFHIVDFGKTSGDTFKARSGRYAQINQLDENTARKALAHWNVERINENFEEFLSEFFPELCGHKLLSDLDEDTIEELRDSFVDELLSHDTLAEHVVSILKGCAGVMVHRTSEFTTGKTYINDMLSIPTDGLETSEFVDLSTKRLQKLERTITNYDYSESFYGCIDHPLDFEDFEIFMPYILHLENTKCELRIDAIYGSFLASCVMRNSFEVDGDVHIIRLEERVFEKEDSIDLCTTILKMLKPSAGDFYLDTCHDYLKELESYNPPMTSLDPLWDKLRAGKARSVLESAQSLAVQFPQSHKPLLLLGAAFDTMGEIEEALKCFSQAIVLSPNSSAHHNLAALLIKGERYKEALPVLLRAAALDPYNQSIIKNLEFVRHKLKISTLVKRSPIKTFRKSRNIVLPSD